MDFEAGDLDTCVQVAAVIFYALMGRDSFGGKRLGRRLLLLLPLLPSLLPCLADLSIPNVPDGALS